MYVSLLDPLPPGLRLLRAGQVWREQRGHGARSAEAVALGAVVLAVAQAAEDLAVRGVAALGRVQGALAVQAAARRGRKGQ